MSFDFVLSIRETRSSPQRAYELPDRRQTVSHYPQDLCPTSRHSRGPDMRGWSTRCAQDADPVMRHILGGEPVERDRMGARCGELIAHGLG